MSTHTLRTELLLTIGGEQIEYPATITYYRHKAYDGGREEPSNDAHCEIDRITIDLADGRHILLADLIVDQFQKGLHPDLMDAWADDIAAAEDARYEARRDDMMMERF